MNMLERDIESGEVELVEAEMASAEESQIGLDQVRTQSELVTQGRGYIDDLGQTEPGTGPRNPRGTFVRARDCHSAGAGRLWFD